MRRLNRPRTPQIGAHDGNEEPEICTFGPRVSQETPRNSKKRPRSPKRSPGDPQKYKKRPRTRPKGHPDRAPI
eukprot:3914894-Pyramimonas_sp.AAC.1